MKKNFIDLLENLEENGKKINCKYQTYIHSKKLKPGKAVEILCQVIHLKDKTPYSLFGIASDQSVTVIDKKSFEDAIKVNAGIDLTDQEWFTLFDDLTNKDGQIELALVFRNFADYTPNYLPINFSMRLFLSFANSQNVLFSRIYSPSLSHSILFHSIPLNHLQTYK